MEIERKFYTEALRRVQAEKETEDREEMARMVIEMGERMERQIKVLNADKQKWFEGLAGSVLEFAEACDLDVKMRITDDLYGSIQFETSYFELSWSEPPVVHAFWLYLCSSASRFSIVQCPEVFRIEFLYALFDGQ